MQPTDDRTLCKNAHGCLIAGVSCPQRSVRTYTISGIEEARAEDRRLVKAADNGATPLMAACLDGHAEIAEYLLDQGCDVNHADNNGCTSLHFDAYNGHLHVAQVLFRYGAKLDARTNNGSTPADIATALGHPTIADAIRTEELRRRDDGCKRDSSTIEGTEEHEAAKRPRKE